MEKSETGKILRFVLTPQIVPRVRELFFSGFSFVAFFMAQIYRMARLLPDGHPYLSSVNVGKFGIRHVIAEAANNLKFNKENLDQILVFVLMLTGTALLCVQILLLLTGMFVDAAHAGFIFNPGGPVPNTFAAYFLVPNATNDLAFVLLDRVFGVPNIFLDAAGGQTCTAAGTVCFDPKVLNPGTTNTRVLTPDGTIRNSVALVGGAVQAQGAINVPWPWPFHLALHRMFELYSYGILYVAALILAYLVAAVVAETAQSGTPFGRRFNHVWAPLRLVAAIGLLIPLASGLNTGQYILLYAAKYGSGFATNGWQLFYNNATDAAGAFTRNTPMGPVYTLMARPTGMPANTLVQYATVLAVCRIAYQRMYYTHSGRANAPTIEAWLVNPANATGTPLDLRNTDFDTAVQFFNGQNMIIKFGVYSTANQYQTYDMQVAPLCGQITFRLPATPGPTGGASFNAATALANHSPGVDAALYFYYEILQTMWADVRAAPFNNPAACQYATDAELQAQLTAANNSPTGHWFNYTMPPTSASLTFDAAIRTVIDGALAGGTTTTASGGSTGFGCMGQNIANRYLPIYNNPQAPLPTSTYLEYMRHGYEYFLDGIADLGRIYQMRSPVLTETTIDLGWGGAGIWYNRVAELNGSLSGAVYSLPAVTHYPEIMETVKSRRAESDTDTPGAIRYNPSRAGDSPIVLDDAEHNIMARSMNVAVQVWEDHTSEAKQGGDIWADMLHAIFGTRGLFDLQRHTVDQTHPLAQLAAVGRSILDSAISNLGYSAMAGLGGGAVNLFTDHMIGRVAMTASGFFSQLGMFGLVLGFVLYYVVPLLPFIYFFFAVGGWIKGIFEAMVGMPLWALAHLRIDGNGLPGDAALGGYYLILEVFLRPILIVFGLLASISIFAAQVRVLHEIWSIVTSNVSGFDKQAAQFGTTPYDPDATGGLRYARSVIDEFFFTVIYAIVVYMMGMSAFKLIDMIPNHILRWMGASVSTFGDQSGDAAENLVRNSMMGGQMVSGQLQGALGGMRSAATEGGAAIRELGAKKE